MYHRVPYQGMTLDGGHVENPISIKITVIQWLFPAILTTIIQQTKSANNRKTGKTAMALTWYRHFQWNGGLNKILRRQNLAGSIYVRSSIKLLHLFPFDQQTWLLLLKIEHMVKLYVFGNNSKISNQIFCKISG
jgi:hypothetical protein